MGCNHPLGRFKLSGDGTCCVCCPDDADSVLFEDDFSTVLDGWSEWAALTYSQTSGTLAVYKNAGPMWQTGRYIYYRPVCAEPGNGAYIYAEAKVTPAYTDSTVAAGVAFVQIGGAVTYGIGVGVSNGWYYHWPYASTGRISAGAAAGDVLGVKIKSTGGNNPAELTLYANGSVLWTGTTSGGNSWFCSRANPSLQPRASLETLAAWQLTGLVCEYDDFHFESGF